MRVVQKAATTHRYGLEKTDGGLIFILSFSLQLLLAVPRLIAHIPELGCVGSHALLVPTSA